MKKCIQCGTIADSKFCPNCGAPMPDEELLEKDIIDDDLKRNVDTKETIIDNQVQSETLIENGEAEKSKKKVLIIAIIAAVVIIGAIIIGIAVSKSSDEGRYADNLNVLSNEIISGASDAESQCNLILAVWHDSIFEEVNDNTKKYVSGTDDFNDALGNLFADEDFQATNESIETSKGVVDMIMEELKDPPEKYEKCYDVALELYGKYNAITNMALDPTGSYETFTDDFSDVDSELLEIYNKYTTMIPSSEEY